MKELKFKVYIKKEKKIYTVRSIDFHDNEVEYYYSENSGCGVVGFNDCFLFQYIGKNDQGEEIYEYEKYKVIWEFNGKEVEWSVLPE